jgi:hypothetical protein
MTITELERRPRLSVDISLEQAQSLDRYIPWGLRRRVFLALIDLLIAAFERGGAEVLLSIIQKELDLPGLFLKEK